MVGLAAAGAATLISLPEDLDFVLEGCVVLLKLLELSVKSCKLSENGLICWVNGRDGACVGVSHVGCRSLLTEYSRGTSLR